MTGFMPDLRGVSTLTNWGHVTYVPIVPQTSFWYQKKRKEISVTSRRLYPIESFSLKFSRPQKSSVSAWTINIRFYRVFIYTVASFFRWQRNIYTVASFFRWQRNRKVNLYINQQIESCISYLTNFQFKKSNGYMHVYIQIHIMHLWQVHCYKHHLC